MAEKIVQTAGRNQLGERRQRLSTNDERILSFPIEGAVYPMSLFWKKTATDCLKNLLPALRRRLLKKKMPPYWMQYTAEGRDRNNPYYHEL